MIAAIRKAAPETTIEVLTPDFLRKPGGAETIAAAHPDVFNHNLETVPRLYPAIRPGARYYQSLRLLDRVKALTSHPAFSMANPNRVRALIGSFATMNQSQANRVDGAGYDYIIETVLALDPMNPQVAARLLSALKSWRMFEPMRRSLAEAALRRVADAPSLSRDVSDIVSRALAAAS